MVYLLIPTITVLNIPHTPQYIKNIGHNLKLYENIVYSYILYFNLAKERTVCNLPTSLTWGKIIFTSKCNMNSLFSWKCHRLFCLRQLMINQQSTTEATEATVYQLSTKPSLLLGFQSSVQHNYFMIRAFWEAPDFLEPSQKEGLALLVDPEGRVTSAIVSQSQGRWGGSSEMQQETKYTATSSTRSLGHITETVFQLGRQHNQ